MTKSQSPTTDTIRQIIEQQLNLAAHGHDLGPDDNLWDLGMTSLTCLGLMLNLEDTLEIELPEEALKESTFRSVNSIVAAVEGARGNGQESGQKSRAEEGASSHH